MACWAYCRCQRLFGYTTLCYRGRLGQFLAWRYGLAQKIFAAQANDKKQALSLQVLQAGQRQEIAIPLGEEIPLSLAVPATVFYNSCCYWRC